MEAQMMVPNGSVQIPPPPRDRHLWQLQPVRDLLWVLLAAALLALAYQLRGILLPIFTALVIAYLLDPLISRAERLGMPRLWSVTLVSLFLLGLTIAAVLWMVPLLQEQISALLQQFPDYMQAIAERYNLQLGDLSGQLATLLESLQQDPASAFRLLGSILGTTTQVVLWLMLVPFFFFYFTWRYPRLTETVKYWLPPNHRERTLQVLGRMDQEVGGFFRGRLLTAVLCGFLFAFGWYLAQVPYWFLLGMVTGLISFVPYISAVGWLAAMMIKYLEMGLGGAGFDWMAVILWPSIAYTVVNIIEEGVFTPLIQSRTTALKPVTVLVVALVGGKLAGFFGLILAIPVAVCLKVLFDEIMLHRLRHWLSSV
jgi:predicted PurR-regulated permease PerM